MNLENLILKDFFSLNIFEFQEAMKERLYLQFWISDRGFKFLQTAIRLP